MTEDQPHAASRTQSFGRHALAAVVLLICAFLLFHLLFHLVIFIATVAAVVVAVIGAIWAIHVLF
jgi:membrane protein YdbS with pleckstrin-like domain